jgi:hypothetical protein
MMVFGGAFNHLSVDEFIDFVFAQGWEEPSRVQVFINGEEEDRFNEILRPA